MYCNLVWAASRFLLGLLLTSILFVVDAQAQSNSQIQIVPQTRCSERLLRGGVQERPTARDLPVDPQGDSIAKPA